MRIAVLVVVSDHEELPERGTAMCCVGVTLRALTVKAAAAPRYSVEGGAAPDWAFCGV
jgi:hypothetical protein